MNMLTFLHALEHLEWNASFACMTVFVFKSNVDRRFRYILTFTIKDIYLCLRQEVRVMLELISNEELEPERKVNTSQKDASFHPVLRTIMGQYVFKKVTIH